MSARNWLFCFLISALSLAPLSAATIVVGDPGNTSNYFPFGGRYSSANPGTRYQQAYSAANFSQPMLISGISFTGGVGDFVASTYSLYLSTIAADIDSLSTTDFDANRGADNTLFVSIPLSGAAPATLTFTGLPFVYDPAVGNLLLDMVVSPGGVTAQAGVTVRYDSRNNAPGIFSRYHDFGDGFTGVGLVTTFDFESVPEPATLALIGSGLVLAAWWGRRRRRG